MINEIYRQYFQKSFTFLYPLLGFNRTSHPRPLKTFMFWKGYPEESNMLFCLYNREGTKEWFNFESTKLITHKMLHDCIELDDDQIMYVFNMGDHVNEINAVLNGKYSTMSKTAKSLITDYYGVTSPEWVYMESFMFPSKYFKIYADILDADVNIIKEVGELCPPCDFQKETCEIKIAMLEM